MAELTVQQKKAIALAKAKAIASAGAAGPKHPLMSQVNKGIAEAAGGLVDFVNPFDQPHALNPFPGGTGSAQTGLETLMSKGGIEVAQEAPTTTVEGFARGSGQAAGSLVPVAKGLQALRGAGGAVGQFADDAYRAMTTYMAPATEVTAGGISGAAEELAENAGAPEWVQNTAAVAAPMSIPAAVGLGKASSRITPVGIATRRIGAALAPYTKSGAKAVATERMQSLAGGRERADELAGRIGGENPLALTPAQQTGDPNMLAVENLASQQDPNLREALQSRRAQSAETARTSISDMGGDVETAQQFFEKNRRNYKKMLQAQADGVIANADQRLSGVSASRSETENSRAVTEAIQGQLESSLKRERELWNAIPQDEIVGTGTAKATASDLVDQTPFAQRNDIPRAVRDLLESPDVYGDDASVREMYGLYSELRRVSRSAMAGNDQNKNMARIANEVADAILEDLGAKAGTTEAGKLINDARAFSAALHETFDRGAPGRLLKRTLDGDSAIDPEMALKRTVGRGGPEGLVTSRQIETAGGENARAAVEDYISGEFASSAVNSGTGEVNLAGARRWMAKNRELLTRYPELRGDIEAAVKQRESAEQISARIANRISALEDTRRSAVAKFIGGQPGDAVKAILDAKNPIQAAQRLANEARRDPSRQALSGLKGAITDHLIGSSLRTKGSQTGLDANALAKVLADPKLTSAMKRIFTDAELTRMKAMSRELAKAQATASADIGTELSGAKANRLLEWVARIGAARHGADLGGGSGGSIQTAQMASSRMKELLNHLASDKASQMIADAVTDPALFKALLTQTGSAKALDRALPRFIPYLVGGSTAAAGS